MTVGDGIWTASRTVYGEARGEAQRGREAVAHVIMTRLASGKWFGGDTLSEVCLRPYQFACWNTDDPNRPKIMDAGFEDKAFIECMCAMLGAMSKLTIDPTDGATHYHASSVFPDWAEGHESSGLAIGRHIFYAGID